MNRGGDAVENREQDSCSFIGTVVPLIIGIVEGFKCKSVSLSKSFRKVEDCLDVPRQTTMLVIDWRNN